jgi:hypothetical protein
MDYRKIGDSYYIRMNRGDEIISNFLAVCKKESIPSTVSSGIGGCQSAELQVFVPSHVIYDSWRAIGTTFYVLIILQR